MAKEAMPVHNQPVFFGQYTNSWLSIIPHKEESQTMAILVEKSPREFFRWYFYSKVLD